jgi:hypothetical protein
MFIYNYISNLTVTLLNSPQKKSNKVRSYLGKTIPVFQTYTSLYDSKTERVDAISECTACLLYEGRLLDGGGDRGRLGGGRGRGRGGV